MLLHDFCVICAVFFIVCHPVVVFVGIGSPVAVYKYISLIRSLQLVVHPNVVTGIVYLIAVAIPYAESTVGIHISEVVAPYC